MSSASTTSPTDHWPPPPAPTATGSRATTGAYAAPLGDEDEDARPRVLVVQVGEARYGLPITQVREVVRAGRITRVPGAPPLVRGILNVRGAVVTVLELSVLLGAPRAVTSSSVVLLEHGTRLIGLAVDMVRDVRAHDPVAETDSAGSGPASVTPLDAVALCAPHLLSAEEMGR